MLNQVKILKRYKLPTETAYLLEEDCKNKDWETELKRKMQKNIARICNKPLVLDTNTLKFSFEIHAQTLH